MNNRKYVLITGSSGLVGSECVEFFINKKFNVIGVDNDYRSFFFGKSASIKKREKFLSKKYPEYKIFNNDIRNLNEIKKIFLEYKNKIKLIIHCAAQPSHDWATKDPLLDFDINARSTLNLLNLFKTYCPKSSFIFVSTNKVYGDKPNQIPVIEKKFRYELKNNHYFKNGFDESLSIDNSIHSFFGVSKTSADLYVQEFGKNFKLNTVSFRCGCITGENHSGSEAHGFLNYLIKNIIEKKTYKIIGYKGKQVRDNIHSHDLVSCFWEYYKNPKKGKIYNIGGGRNNSCSIIEVIKKLEVFLNIKVKKKYIKFNRTGDHIWWITNTSKFKKDYPKWKIKINLDQIIKRIINKYKIN